MLAGVRASDFNDFVKSAIRWESGALCAIGAATALEAIRK